MKCYDLDAKNELTDKLGINEKIIYELENLLKSDKSIASASNIFDKQAETIPVDFEATLTKHFEIVPELLVSVK